MASLPLVEQFSGLGSKTQLAISTCIAVSRYGPDLPVALEQLQSRWGWLCALISFQSYNKHLFQSCVCMRHLILQFPGSLRAISSADSLEILVSLSQGSTFAIPSVTMEVASLLNRPVPIRARLALIPEPTAYSPPAPDPETDPSGDHDASRSAPYTLVDDLSILKVVAAYYGFGFQGKIPWSFWQTYKRVTHSTRSNSSLYHHWNGAMRKKYEQFLTTGRMSECILWLETAAMADHAPPTPAGPPAGTPLCHVRSEPPVRLGLTAQSQPQPFRPLIRTASHLPQACNRLGRMPDVLTPRREEGKQ
jgi:hypothetical protein